MARIAYTLGNALISLYLAAASPAYADSSSANSPMEKIEARVQQSAPGLESVINGTTIQHGFFQGKYRVDADLTLKSRKTIPGPLTIDYSLCFTDGKSVACIDGNSEHFPESLPAGELKRRLQMKQRFPFKELEFDTGKKIPLTKLRPKITIQLKMKNQLLYRIDHYLPPVQNYECKKWCPG